MKVVILHPPLYPMNHALFDLLGQYVELVVYCFGNHPKLHPNWLTSEYQKEAKNYKIVLLNNGISTFKSQFNFKAFMSLIKEKPDVVMSVAFWIPSLYSSLLSRVLDFKFIVVTDAILETDKGISSLKRKVRQVICKNTNVVISASDLTTKYIETINKDTKVMKSLQTIDLKNWKESLLNLEDKNTLRKALNIPVDQTVILSVGAFISLKNWESVFKHIKELENYHYVLIGAGILEETYLAYIKNNKLEDRISIVSRKEGLELKKYFKSSDIFIFPSIKDTFGYVVPEALISGLPVICSDKAGASSLLEDGINGYVVNSKNDFLQEIEAIKKNIGIMSLNSVKSIEKYTMQNKAKEYYKILQEVLND